MNKTLSFKQIANLIATVGDKLTVLVEGENGIGKTAIFHHLASMEQFKNHIKVQPIDCTQLSDGSIWMPDIDKDNGVSRELPNERLGVSKTNQRGVNGSRPVLMMFDEIAKARQYVKDMIAPIVYERRVGNYFLPEGSVVFAATNLSAEGLGDMLQAHLRNRLVVVRMRKPNHEEYSAWAISNGVRPEIVVTNEETPEVYHSFVDYMEGGEHHHKDRALAKSNPYIFDPSNPGQMSYASPRSMARCSPVVEAYVNGVLDDSTATEAMVGIAGAPYADKLMAMIRFGQQLPNIKDIKAHPDTTPLPSNKLAQIFQVMQFISRTETREDASAFCKYVARMGGEFEALFTRRIVDSPKVGMFATVPEFGEMLARNQIYYKV